MGGANGMLGKDGCGVYGEETSECKVVYYPCPMLRNFGQSVKYRMS